MRIAVVHYHLRRGGVTRVVGNTLSALVPLGVRMAVLAEECPGLAPEWRHLADSIPELGYRTDGDASLLEDRLRTSARRLLGGPPDVWHIHNPHLGKNPALTATVAALARAGERLLLHVHDFPEDGRAGNYRTLLEHLGGTEGLRRTLYPVGDRIRHAVLNRRDAGILSAAGLPRGQPWLLSNPVDLPPIEAAEPLDLDGRSLILYPTRAIRRKNLGEFLLWAALAEPGELYGCSLAPENPAAFEVYRYWVERARAWSLPVRFAMGETCSFARLAATSSCWITTSIAEGFGLAFLEPWHAGRTVAGRDLPAITGDFAEAGIDLSHLYTRLDVPLEWLDRTALRRELEASLRRVHQGYMQPVRGLGAAWESLTRGGVVDFGRLGERFQEEIIERVLGSREARSAIVPSRLSGSLSPERIAGNRRVVCARFSAGAYAARLLDGYRELAAVRNGSLGWLDPRAVLRGFLDPGAHSFLKDD